MATLRLKRIIRIRGVNPYVLISNSQAEKLQTGWRKPMPVQVRVNGQPDKPWHINMMPVGNGDFYLYLHGDVRKASGTKVGDEITIELDFDETYKNGPQHPMPPELAQSLRQNPTAQSNWEALPPSRKKEILRYFASLKSAEAIKRNVNRAILSLTADTAHFMGRDWHDGA